MCAVVLALHVHDLWRHIL